MSEIDLQRVQEASGCDELWEVVAQYEGYRPGPDGDGTEVEIKILRGEAGWRVQAKDAAGREAFGNPERELETALATAHWQELDRR